MFSWLKPNPEAPRATQVEVPVTLETLDARLNVLEAEVRRVLRRAGAPERRGLEAALRHLGEQVAREEKVRAEGD